MAKINPGLGNVYVAKRALQEIRGDKRVVTGRGDGKKSFGRSSDFFSELQQQAQMEIASKKEGLKKIKEPPASDPSLSKKLKL